MERGQVMKHIDDIERRLDQAAEETRRSATHSTPPAIVDHRRRITPGWLVFAAAFAAVTLAVGALPLLNPSTGDDPNDSARPSTTLSEMAPPTTPATTAAAGCSAAGLAVPADQPGLPGPVAETRQAIAAAAIACDFPRLQYLAGDDLVTSFGGGGFEHLVELEEAGDEEPMRLLVELLGLPFADQDYVGLPRHFYWPSAFVYDSWEEIPDPDLEALLTVYTREELDQIATFGSYAGWRVGITEDGDWRFFVAGD
jgi:hypothetical protein